MQNATLWVSAFEIGLFYGLLAICYQLIKLGAGFFNFAIGPYAMAAALASSWLTAVRGVPVVWSIVLGVTLGVVLSLATELAIIRPVQARSGGGELPALVAVGAVLFAVQQGAGLMFGRLSMPGLTLAEGTGVRVGPVQVAPFELILIGSSLVITLVLACWMRWSTAGQMLRAVGDNPHAANLLGLPVGKIRLICFGMAGAIAAVAGILFAPKAGVRFDSGLPWTITAFFALVVGGTGTVWAPLVGGVVFGGVTIFAPYYFPSVGMYTPILLLGILFFTVRPQGLVVREVRV